MARTGYTLPVFAVAAAKAALVHLQTQNFPKVIDLDLLPNTIEIPIAQVAAFDRHSALAITHSDPGDNLDLTRNTPIWAKVTLQPRQAEALILEAGEGVGKTLTGEPAIYSYARRLFDANLLPLIPADQTVTVSILLPEGQQLAERTSNKAFGIVEGLSLLGTSGISQPLSAEEHLQDLRAALRTKLEHQTDLVFCIGSNGMQVAGRLGYGEEAIAQTGNWVGALLVEAGLHGATSVLLLGYHGKLIKLAGGIFNTSSHLADGKLEILSAMILRTVTDPEVAYAAACQILQAKTADAAHQMLVELDLAELVFNQLAQRIGDKAKAYVQKYADVTLPITVMLCDRQGHVIAPS
jgi:cobalt-precorrin-5B (C1)-methyltransferase